MKYEKPYTTNYLQQAQNIDKELLLFSNLITWELIVPFPWQPRSRGMLTLSALMEAILLTLSLKTTLARSRIKPH